MIMERDRKELPDGWQWVKLGSICEIKMGRTPPRKISEYWGGSHAWVTISDIQGDTVTETKENISDSGAELCKNRMLKKGTLLFSFKLSIGKTAFAGMDLYTNEAIAGLIPVRQGVVDTVFLRYALATIDFDAVTGHAAKGKTLNMKSMSNLLIPLPPLEEQKRIANVLSEQTAVLKKARKAAEEMLEAIDALRNAIFSELLP